MTASAIASISMRGDRRDTPESTKPRLVTLIVACRELTAPRRGPSERRTCEKRAHEASSKRVPGQRSPSQPSCNVDHLAETVQRGKDVAAVIGHAQLDRAICGAQRLADSSEQLFQTLSAQR